MRPDGGQSDLPDQEREVLLRALAEQSATHALVVDHGGAIRHAGAAMQALLGCPAENLISRDLFSLVHPDDVDELRAAFAPSEAPSDRTIYQEFRVAEPTGDWRWLGASIQALRDEPASQIWLLQLHDISKAHRLDDRSAQQRLLFDRLTGLPNRVLLQDRIERACLAASRSGESLAVLLINIDRFRDVNDALGHTVGDQVLSMVAARLTGALRASDTFARLIGDEFVALLRASDDITALPVVERIVAAFEEPFIVENQPIVLSATMGIALYPSHGKNGDELLRHADVALHNARDLHLPCTVYRSEDDGHTVRRLALRAELRAAIAQDRLAQYYQPKLTLSTGRVEEVEALARWEHPSEGFVPPSEFIQLAERWNAIKPLTLWALRTAMQQAKDWHAAGFPLTVGVNLSTRDLHGQDLVPAVSELLDRTGLDPSALMVEVTEGTLMVDPDHARFVLNQLRALGVKSSVDDFGTGYSSLAYLSRLPLDELKIDASFVAGMARTERDRLIVATTIELGHRLGLTVTAEGVEEKAALAMLAGMGCDKAQGYAISAPLPAGELVSWLTQRDALD